MVFTFFSLYVALINVMIVCEEGRYADYSRDPDQRIDDSRDDHAEVIENEGDEIEIEEADQSPIQGSDNDDDQGDFL